MCVCVYGRQLYVPVRLDIMMYPCLVNVKYRGSKVVGCKVGAGRERKR